MADFIISPYAISFNSIKNALENYITNKSDVTTTWKDFYVAGAGQTVLELDAAVAAFYAFHFIIGRRESFLTVAQNYNSIVGGALSLGYNCSRGHNVFVELKIVPSQTQTLSKWSVIGSYAEYDIVLLEDVVLNAGVATNIKCVIGNLAAQSVTITSAALQQFVFTANDSTDTCRLILTDSEVPFSTQIKDASNDKYVMLTNSFGGVDVFYLNNGKYNYDVSDTLYFQYIQRNNLTFGGLSNSNITLFIANQVEEVNLVEDLTQKEDAEHIRVSAPLYHETNNVVRARKDYVKYLIQNNPLIIDANDKDINPGLIALTYLKKQESEAGTSLLTEAEKQDYIKLMQQICPGGVAKAFIEDPVRVVRSLAISLWQKSNENIAATLEQDIDNILDQYRNRLAPVLDLEQIEHDIEQLPGVKIARVDLGAKKYETNTKYKLYDVITVPDILVGTEYQTWTLYCAKIQAQTGNKEPDWAYAPNVGDQIQDNNFIWENSNKYQNSITGVWKEDGTYELYSDINTSYLVPPFTTLATPPIWGQTLQTDGNVTWNLLKTFDGVLPFKQDNTRYVVNDVMIVKEGDNEAVYEVTGVTHKSGTQEPNWDMAITVDGLLQDNALTWSMQYESRKSAFKYLTGDIVANVHDGVIYVYTATSDGETHDDSKPSEGEETQPETDPNEPLDGAQIVKDGTVTWSLIDTITTYSQWKANTEIPVGTYINGNNRFYTVTKNDNTTVGAMTYFNETWSETVTDNNVILTLQNFELLEETYPCIGTIWKPSSVFNVGDNIIVTSSSDTYLYQVSFSSSEELSVSNAIYSVVNYAGTTGTTEPIWGDDNVVDNDILWTKTENTSDVKWEANTNKRHGDIITTNEGYYVFSSVLGTSGITAPDWTGIRNNQVVDNNITWRRITNSTNMALQWNEYLDLKAISPTIVG